MEDEESSIDAVTETGQAAVETEESKWKKAKRPKSSPKPLLESVSETADDGSNGPPPPKDQEGGKGPVTAGTKDDRSGDCFGVKSYLHHFYEVMSVKDPHLYEDLDGGGVGLGTGACEDDDFRYLFRSKKRRCRAFWWKVALWGSANLLAIGAIVILVGYMAPRRQVVIGQQRDLEIIDRGALRFNRNLDACKVVGLVVFCVGGAALATALLLPTFVCNYCDEEAASAAFVVVRPAKAPSVARYTVKRQRESSSSSSSATSGSVGAVEAETKAKVPVTEQVTGVQPRWNDVECVATTKQGLFSVP